MTTLIILATLWAALLIYASIAELQYYKSVKVEEPKLWQEMGAPSFLRTPIAFMNKANVARLKEITNPTVMALSKKHKISRNIFLSYVVLVLLLGTVYLKLA